MDLHLPFDGLTAYTSASQRARVSTELWGAANLYCACCNSSHLRRQPHNTAAVDYICGNCKSPFQLKSQSKQFGKKIVDSAYSKMRLAILQDRTPNLYLLHYDLPAWSVRTVLLIPRFAFALSAIECRRPLAPTARRAGWVGCNILLENIPTDARIPIIQNGQAVLPDEVRRAYERLRPLESLDVAKRGWTLDVLRTIKSLNKSTFLLAEVYARADTLSQLHPGNRHVRDKIRQQLQVLRNFGIVEFQGRGNYRLR